MHPRAAANPPRPSGQLARRTQLTPATSRGRRRATTRRHVPTPAIAVPASAKSRAGRPVNGSELAGPLEVLALDVGRWNDAAGRLGADRGRRRQDAGDRRDGRARRGHTVGPGAALGREADEVEQRRQVDLAGAVGLVARPDVGAVEHDEIRAALLTAVGLGVQHLDVEQTGEGHLGTVAARVARRLVGSPCSCRVRVKDIDLESVRKVEM
jgi:hypothetical protein